MHWECGPGPPRTESSLTGVFSEVVSRARWEIQKVVLIFPSQPSYAEVMVSTQNTARKLTIFLILCLKAIHEFLTVYAWWQDYWAFFFLLQCTVHDWKQKRTKFLYLIFNVLMQCIYYGNIIERYHSDWQDPVQSKASVYRKWIAASTEAKF